MEKLEGFGPPINKDKIDESLGMNVAEDKIKEDAPEAQAILPKPLKFVVDPNDPIYKTGQNMPGELGRPVNIDKNVILF